MLNCVQNAERNLVQAHFTVVMILKADLFCKNRNFDNKTEIVVNCCFSKYKM